MESEKESGWSVGARWGANILDKRKGSNGEDFGKIGVKGKGMRRAVTGWVGG